jgi:hypothetical protein
MVKKCKMVVKTLKTAVKINCIIRHTLDAHTRSSTLDAH